MLKKKFAILLALCMLLTVFTGVLTALPASASTTSALYFESLAGSTADPLTTTNNTSRFIFYLSADGSNIKLNTNYELTLDIKVTEGLDPVFFYQGSNRTPHIDGYTHTFNITSPSTAGNMVFELRFGNGKQSKVYVSNFEMYAADDTGHISNVAAVYGNFSTWSTSNFSNTNVSHGRLDGFYNGSRSSATTFNCSVISFQNGFFDDGYEPRMLYLESLAGSTGDPVVTNTNTSRFIFYLYADGSNIKLNTNYELSLDIKVTDGLDPVFYFQGNSITPIIDGYTHTFNITSPTTAGNMVLELRFGNGTQSKMYVSNFEMYAAEDTSHITNVAAVFGNFDAWSTSNFSNTNVSHGRLDGFYNGSRKGAGTFNCSRLIMPTGFFDYVYEPKTLYFESSASSSGDPTSGSNSNHSRFLFNMEIDGTKIVAGQNYVLSLYVKVEEGPDPVFWTSNGSGSGVNRIYPLVNGYKHTFNISTAPGATNMTLELRFGNSIQSKVYVTDFEMYAAADTAKENNLTEVFGDFSTWSTSHFNAGDTHGKIQFVVGGVQSSAAACNLSIQAIPEGFFEPLYVPKMMHYATAETEGRFILFFPTTKSINETDGRNFVLTFSLKPEEVGTPLSFIIGSPDGDTINTDPYKVEGNKYTFRIKEVFNFRFGIWFDPSSSGYLSGIEMYEADESWNINPNAENHASMYGDFSDWSKYRYESGPGSLLCTNGMSISETGLLYNIPNGYFNVPVDWPNLINIIEDILLKKVEYSEGCGADVYSNDGIVTIADLLYAQEMFLQYETPIIQEANLFLTGGAESGATELRSSILNSSDTNLSPTGSGKKIYVSAAGNDSNNGTSPSSPIKTMAKAQSMASSTVVEGIVLSADVVLLRRGDVFRLSSNFECESGIKYGAYDDPNLDQGLKKPEVWGAPQDYADTGLWTKVGSTNMWTANVGMQDAGVIAFLNNLGEVEDVGVKMRYKYLPAKNGEYYHDLETGLLYLYCDSGNPGAQYHEIEIGVVPRIFDFEYGAVDIAIENINFKFSSSFGIRGEGCKRINITNCELSFIGGATQEVETFTLFGNGIEFWNGAEDIIVENNWVHNVFDAGITFQGVENKAYENIYFQNNLIEYCRYSIEWWSRNLDATISNINLCDNIMRFSGYGYRWARNGANINQFAHIYGSCEKNYTNPISVVVENNTFDCARSYFVLWGWYNTGSQPSWDMSNNKYYQKTSPRNHAFKFGSSLNGDGAVTYARNESELITAVNAVDSTSSTNIKWID